MKLAPTLEGGLRIDADAVEDWMVLDAICADAAGMPGESLYDRLSEKMVRDDDWEEFVAPDIRDQFSDHQARMTLEHAYQLSELEEFAELDELGHLGDEKLSAVVRGHFYSTFQSLLLEYVLD